MFDQQTIASLHALKLHGFAEALAAQRSQPEAAALSFEERLALLVDRENALRHDRRLARLLQQARLKYSQASLEEAEFGGIRGIDRQRFTALALSEWVGRGEAVLFGGATGLGKTWLACALAQYACRRGHSALYLRVPRLPEELRALHASGGFGRWLAQLARTEVLVLDDWGLGNTDAMLRNDLLEIIDDRAGRRATVIAHQLPVEHWHGWIGDPAIADAILDRLLQRAQRFTLEGESRRTGAQRAARRKAAPGTEAAASAGK